MASANPFTKCESVKEVHNKLMTIICCDYLGAESWKEKFEKFKLKSFLYLETPRERVVCKPYDIWKELERTGKLGLKNYEVLKRLVNDIDDDLTDLIEDAEERICFLEGEVSKRKRRKTEQGSDIFQSFKQKLFEFSKRITEGIPVSPFQNYGMLPVDLLYSKVVVKTKSRYDEQGRRYFEKPKAQRGQKLTVECPDDIFLKNEEPTKRIFMIGNPAHGKTTYCIWLLQHWLSAELRNSSGNQQNEWEKALGKFDIVFLVRLRDVQRSRANATDMICKDVLDLDEESAKWLKHALKTGKYRCFIIIDGLDEWRPDQDVTRNTRFRGIPIIDDITNCVIFITMRPWKFDAVAAILNSDDRVVEIEGLDEKGIKEVTENLLKNYYALDIGKSDGKQKYDSIMNKLKNKTLNSIMRIPLIAVVCVQIWYKGEEIGGSLTQFYVEMINMLIERADGPHVISNLLEVGANNDSFFQTYKCLLCKLGKLAYDGLISGENRFEFPAKTLTKSLGLTKSELEFSLNVGLLSMEETESIMTKKVKLFFFHSSLQEFLGAVYIVQNESNRSQFIEHLTSLKVVLEFGNVLIFLSGLNPTIGSDLSQQIVDIANADLDICSYRKFNDVLMNNNNIVELLYTLQVNCFREIRCVQSDMENTEHVIPYHVSDVYLDDESDKETISATVDILTHHYADVRSLLPYVISNDVENGIPDSVLTYFLDHTGSLEGLYIDGYSTGRSLHRLNDRLSSLTALVLYGVTLSPLAFNTLQSALQTNSLIETLGLISITCQASAGQDHEPAPLSGILQILPKLPRLSKLSIKITNEHDKPVFRDVLSRLSHLHDIHFCGTKPRDNEYDRCVVQTLCTWTGLRRLRLVYLDLLYSVLLLSHDMSNIEKIMLYRVSMLPMSWERLVESLLNINHTFEVDLTLVDIDEETLSMITSSPHFEVHNEERRIIKFTRVWPPLPR